MKPGDRVRVTMLDFTYCQGWGQESRTSAILLFLPFLGRTGDVVYCSDEWPHLVNFGLSVPWPFALKELEVIESCGARQIRVGDRVKLVRVSLHGFPINSKRTMLDRYLPHLGELATVCYSSPDSIVPYDILLDDGTALGVKADEIELVVQEMGITG